MSKWILPTQKGVEVFPQVAKAPVAVRVEGVEPHTELARTIVHRFANQISHFQRSQAQKYSLSTVDNYRAHGVYPDLKMTYTNLQGQETIHIVVADHVVEEEQAKLPPPPYDWAVVDVTMANFFYTYIVSGFNAWSQMQFVAKVVSPIITDVRTPDGITPVKGEAGLRTPYETAFSGEIRRGQYTPVVQWANSSTGWLVDEVAVDGSDYVASLLVDVREFPFKEVVVAIYGGVAAMDDDTEVVASDLAAFYSRQLGATPDELFTAGTLTGSTTQASALPSPYTDYHIVGPIIAAMSGYTVYVGTGATPALSPGDYYPPGIDYLYTSGQVLEDEPQGARTSTPLGGGLTRWDFYENVLHYDIYPLHNWDLANVPVTPVVTATITATMIRGTPSWGYSDHLVSGAGDDYGLWEIQTKYPLRVNMPQIASNVAIEVLTPEQKVGSVRPMPLIGHLHIDREHGVVTFSSA